MKEGYTGGAPEIESLHVRRAMFDIETHGASGFEESHRLDQNRSVRHSRKAEYAAVALGFVGIAQRFGVVVG